MPEKKQAPAVCRNQGQRPWSFRRKVVVGALGFCAGCVAWVLFKELDNETVRTIVSGAFGLAGAVIGSYIFGAVWDDKRKDD